MEVNLIYSKTDPKQLMTRNFVIDYIRDRGVLATVNEQEQPVASTTVIIDGHRITEANHEGSRATSRVGPNLDLIALALERHCWCL